MRKVYIVNGSGGVGKDTFIAKIADHIPIHVISVIDKVKTVAKEIGWTGIKDEKSRKLLSDLQDLTDCYNDLSFQDIVAKMEYIPSHLNSCIFIVARKDYHINKIIEAYNARTILIKNDNAESILSNVADAGVYDRKYDIIIDNSQSLKHLEDMAKKFIEDEGLL